MSPERATGGVAGARRVRISIVGLIVLSLFAALAIRLVDLQLVDGAELAAAAESNKIRTVYEEAPRGRILDRNGEVIVGNRDVDVIEVDRETVARDDTLLPRLAVFLGQPVEDLQRRMNDTAASIYKPAVVASNIDKSVIASFRERSSEFVGATAATQVQRWYPYGTLAAQTLGYVGEINQDEMGANDDQGYQLGDDIGKTGLESAYEDVLRGRAGIDEIEVNSGGESVRVVDRTPPVAGSDIRLNIDLKVQQAAETALADGLRTARGGKDNPADNPGTPATGGAVVAVDPQDGGVLAIASYPTYDPNQFVGGISSDEYAKLTADDSYLPLTNRAIAGQYAPGSTFKPVTALAALNTGVISANTIYTDTGRYVLGNRSYRNAQGAVYGPVDMSKALAVSVDTYFYTLGEQFWEQREALGHPIQDEAVEFGLGSKTGIDISGETAGRVPTPENRAELHAANPTAFPEGNWYGGDNVNVAIGQGDTLATPIQLANLYATFANGGTVWQTRLVDAVLDSAGNPTRTYEPKKLGTVELPDRIYGPVESGLVGAVSGPGGTGTRSFQGFDLAAFPIAGKTGTAQYTDKQDSALFTGYGPVGDPSISVAVMAEQAGFGGVVAAPIARQVFAASAGQATGEVQLGDGVD